MARVKLERAALLALMLGSCGDAAGRLLYRDEVRALAVEAQLPELRRVARASRLLNDRVDELERRVDALR